MLKYIAVLGTATVALIIFVAPAVAAPSWSHNHERLQEDGTATITGNTRFEGQIGSVECQVTSMAQLTAESTTGTIDSFHVDQQGGETVTDNCQVGGGLASLGCTDVASVTTEGLPWTLHTVSTQTISVTTGTVQNHLDGGIFCPKTPQLTPGTVNITTTTEDTWTEGQLSGELQVHSNGTTQQVAITGSGSLTEGAGTYGADPPEN